MIHRILVSVALLGLLCPRASAAQKAALTSSGGPATGSQASIDSPQGTAGNEVGVIETSRGTIVVHFYDQDAPKTVANFKKLASIGFYTGTTFHRIVPGFVIQGGDPNSKDSDRSNDGQGGPGYTIPAEIKRLHKRGAVAMARQVDQVNPQRQSNGSQFFICLTDLPRLDQGGYTVFGEVIEGMDVVDKIAAIPRDSHDNPTTPVVMLKVTLRAPAGGDSVAASAGRAAPATVWQAAGSKGQSIGTRAGTRPAGSVRGVVTYYHNAVVGDMADVGANVWLVRGTVPISPDSLLMLPRLLLGKPETLAHATADAAGAYEFRDIAAGEYTLVFVSQHRTMSDRYSPQSGTPVGFVHAEVVYIEPGKTVASNCRFGLTPDD
jgi:cyclophilin family peptidyl-prolyl cis-trans isomerase